MTIPVILLTIPAGTAWQKARPEPGKKASITQEEKEIVKNRDVLENLDLLQDLEKFRLFKLFILDPEPEKNRDSKKPEPQKEQKKAK